MDKQIVLKSNHGCSPLWVYVNRELTDNPDPDELPVTTDLKEALARWSAVYEGTCDLEDPLHSGFATTAEEVAFEAEGRRLCAELQVQLGVEYRVEYLRPRDTRSPDPEPSPSRFVEEHTGSHAPVPARSFGDRRP